MQRWRSFPRSSTLTSALNPHPPGIWKKGYPVVEQEAKHPKNSELICDSSIQFRTIKGDVSFDPRSPISYLGVWNPSWLMGVSGPGKSWFTIKIINLTLLNISLESLDLVEFLSGKDPEAQQASSNVVDTIEARHFGGRCWRGSHTESLEFACAFILFHSSYAPCTIAFTPKKAQIDVQQYDICEAKGDSVPKSSMWAVRTPKAELKSLCLDPGQI